MKAIVDMEGPSSVYSHRNVKLRAAKSGAMPKSIR